jgi:hypothetical protein
MRPLAGAWGLVVVAGRTTPTAGAPVRLVGDVPAADSTRTDTAAMMAGRWLPTPPPANRHDGDVVVGLHASTDTDEPAMADVEILAAADGLIGEFAGSTAPRRRQAPDAVAALIEAGLVSVGDQVLFDGHTATMRDGGVLHDRERHCDDECDVEDPADSQGRLR